MKGAVIDMGTNSFSLLVYNKTPEKREDLTTDKVFVNLGEGGINKKILAPEAMERAYSALESFVETSAKHGVPSSEITAFGTSALRDATNSDDFLDRIKKNLGVAVTLINGVQEAEIVFKAVNEIHTFNPGSSCIMDIGGGSTEFTLIKGNQVQDKMTFDIGLSRLVQRFDLQDPLSDKNIQDIQVFLEKNTHSFFEPKEVDDLIGVGGSFETYYHILYEMMDYKYTETYFLPITDLHKVLDELIHSTKVERDANDWIVDFRKRMINVAALKTKWALQQVNAKACYFSPASLKEGIIISDI